MAHNRQRATQLHDRRAEASGSACHIKPPHAGDVSSLLRHELDQIVASPRHTRTTLPTVTQPPQWSAHYEVPCVALLLGRTMRAQAEESSSHRGEQLAQKNLGPRARRLEVAFANPPRPPPPRQRANQRRSERFGASSTVQVEVEAAPADQTGSGEGAMRLPQLARPGNHQQHRPGRSRVGHKHRRKPPPPLPPLDSELDAVVARLRDTLATQWSTVRAQMLKWDADGNGLASAGLATNASALSPAEPSAGCWRARTRRTPPSLPVAWSQMPLPHPARPALQLDLCQRALSSSPTQIDRWEWAAALPVALGLVGSISTEDAGRLFDHFDTDGSNSLDLRELHHYLRAGAAVSLEAPLVAGAVDFDTQVSQRHAVRKQARDHAGSNVLHGLNLEMDASDAPSVIETLREALAAKLGRVIDLFRECAPRPPMGTRWGRDGVGAHLCATHGCARAPTQPGLLPRERVSVPPRVCVLCCCRWQGMQTAQGTLTDASSSAQCRLPG